MSLWWSMISSSVRVFRRPLRCPFPGVSGESRLFCALADISPSQCWGVVCSHIFGHGLGRSDFLQSESLGVATYFAPQQAYAFEIFPSGDRVFTWGPHDTPAVWDITAGATARRICSLPGFVRSAALFHGEARLGTCNSTDTVSIWDASTCELLREWRHPGLVADIVVPRVGHGVLTLMEAGEAPPRGGLARSGERRVCVSWGVVGQEARPQGRAKSSPRCAHGGAE